MTVLRRILVYVLVALLFFGLGYYAFVNFTYSEGSRTGLLYKFSKKGYVFKTWEGELNLGGVSQQNNTIMNNIWTFSVKIGEDAAIDTLQNYEGKRVKLWYKEKMGHFPWQGETNYFVYKAEIVE